MIERNHHLVVASSELLECSCLLLEKGNKRLERAACLELDGEWMFDEVCPCPVFVFFAGSLKKCLEDSVFRRGTHSTETRWRMVVVEVRVRLCASPPRYPSISISARMNTDIAPLTSTRGVLYCIVCIEMAIETRLRVIRRFGNSAQCPCFVYIKST